MFHSSLNAVFICALLKSLNASFLNWLLKIFQYCMKVTVEKSTTAQGLSMFSLVWYCDTFLGTAITSNFPFPFRHICAHIWSIEWKMLRCTVLVRHFSSHLSLYCYRSKTSFLNCIYSEQWHFCFSFAVAR